MSKCSVIVPTLNEERYIYQALSSLRAQGWEHEIIIVDSGSTDRTIDKAEKIADKIIQAPRGKLIARNIGISAARSDLIVSVDADTFYPSGWLDRMTAHLMNSSVSGVTGPRLYDDKKAGWIWSIPAIFNWRFFGSNSAFRRSDYYRIGGFNLGINQKDSKSMVQEEEINFLNKLKTLGQVVFDYRAYVITSGRRFNDVDPKFQQEKRLIRF